MEVAAKRIERATQLASHELVAHRIPIDPEDEEAAIMFKEEWQNCAHGEIDGSSSHDGRAHRPSLLRQLSKSSVEIDEEEKALEKALEEKKKEEAAKT